MGPVGPGCELMTLTGGGGVCEGLVPVYGGRTPVIGPGRRTVPLLYHAKTPE